MLWNCTFHRGMGATLDGKCGTISDHSQVKWYIFPLGDIIVIGNKNYNAY